MKKFRSCIFAITLGLVGIGMTLAPLSVFAGRSDTLAYLNYANEYQAVSDYYAVYGLSYNSQSARYYEYIYSYYSYIYLYYAWLYAPYGSQMEYYAGVSFTYQYYAYIYALYGYSYNTSYYESTAAYYSYLGQAYAGIANYKAVQNN